MDSLSTIFQLSAPATKAEFAAFPQTPLDPISIEKVELKIQLISDEMDE
jgi:hypothetical protein